MNLKFCKKCKYYIPEIIFPFEGDQSTHKIKASWARHCSGFEFGAKDLMVKKVPLAKSTDCVSGAQAKA